jgi:hypothetical protein
VLYFAIGGGGRPVDLVSLDAMSHLPRPEISAIWVVVATALVLGLAGCAAELGHKPSSSPLEAAPYVGVFTGEFVDGRPLYRFPPILVIGSRYNVGPDI